MAPLAKKVNKKYTYGDYLAWSDDERWELINGTPYNMTPAPSRQHQEISGLLFYQLYDYLKDKKCKVYQAPFDVRLPQGKEKDEDIITVVQPDIAVICDEKKLDDKGCRGAPDLIIEISSPSSSAKDLKEKFNLYEFYGVKEYWIVQPEQKIIAVFVLTKKKLYGRPEMYTFEDEIMVGVLKECRILLGDV